MASPHASLGERFHHILHKLNVTLSDTELPQYIAGQHWVRGCMGKPYFWLIVAVAGPLVLQWLGNRARNASFSWPWVLRSSTGSNCRRSAVTLPSIMSP